MKPPVILIDMSNLFYRCHYAHRSLSADGKLTGLQYGVLKAIHDLRENVSKRLVACWDHGIPVPGAPRPKNWRDDAMPSYKANRSHDQSETNQIFEQLPDLARAICSLGYSHASVMGLEADDIIGILSHEIKDDVLVFSTDRDFYQLLDSHVNILVPKKNKGLFQRITASDVEREWGFKIERWPEFLALGGDSSDNIKPMRGMGPKTAAKLIKAGIDLGRNLESQPSAFIDKYGAVWSSIMQSYEAARLPRLWSDPRIASCVKSPLIISPYQAWANKSSSLEYFIKFCANRNMATLLSLRRQLFETGEQPCQKPQPPNPSPNAYTKSTFAKLLGRKPKPTRPRVTLI